MSTQSDLAELYTAFFNRAPDSAGLAYWVNQLNAGNLTLGQIAKNWVQSQPEGQAKYPSGMSTTDFINAIYGNVLSRTSDTDGLAYWKGQLDSGLISRDTFVATVINGAKSNTSAQGKADAALLSNKAAVGIAFADKGLNDTALAAKVLTSVSADSNTLTATLDLIKLVPSTAAGQTSAVLNSLSTALGNVANLIKASPADLANLATYLNAVLTGVTSNTNLDTLFTSINNKVVAAQTNPAALADAANQGANDAAIATPTAGGGGTTPPVTIPTFTVTNGTNETVGKFTVGSQNGDVKIAIVDDKVVFTPANGAAVSVTLTDITKGLMANSVLIISADDLTTLTAGTHQVTGTGVVSLTSTSVVTAAQLNIFDSHIVGKVSVAAVTGSIAGTQADLLTALNSTGISGLAAHAVTISDAVNIAQVKAVDDKTTGAVTVTGITDTAAHLITNAGGYLKSGVAVNVSDDASIAQLNAIKGLTGAVPTHGTIVDTVANLALDLGSEHPLVQGDEFTVNDSLENVLNAIGEHTLPEGFIYSLTNANVVVPAQVQFSVTDGQQVLAFLQAVVDNAENHPSLTLDATFTLYDTVENLTDALNNHLSVMAGDRPYVVVDSLASVLGAKASVESPLSLSHYTLTDASIDLGSNLSVADATLLKAQAQAVVDGAENDPALSLDADYTIIDTVANLQHDVDSPNPLTTGHDYSVKDTLANIVADKGTDSDLSYATYTLTDTSFNVGSDLTVQALMAAELPVQSVYAGAAGDKAPLVFNYSLADTVEHLVANATLLIGHDFTVNDSLANIQAYLSGDTSALGDDFAYNLTSTHIEVTDSIGVVAALALQAQYTALINSAVNKADLTLDMVFTHLHGSAADLANEDYAAVVLGQHVTVDGDFITFEELANVQAAVGNGINAGVDYSGLQGDIADLLGAGELIADHAVQVTGGLSIAQYADLAETGVTLIDYSVVSDSVAALTNLVNAALVSGKTLQITGTASISDIQAVQTAAGNDGDVTYTTVTDSFGNLTNDANAALVEDHNAVITGTVSLQNIADVQAIVGEGSVQYGAIADSVEHLTDSANLSLITGHALTVSNAADIAQLLTLKTAAGDSGLTYTSVSDSYAHLTAQNAAGLLAGKSVNVTDDSLSIAQITAIEQAGATLVGYDTVTDSLANLSNPLNAGLLANHDVVINESVSVAQVGTVKAVSDIGAVSYSTLSDNAANLDAASNAVLGAAATVNFTDAATIAQLTNVDGKTGATLAYSSVIDSAANLVTNTGGYVKNAVNVTVSDTANLAQLAAIDLETTGTLTATNIADGAVALALNAGGYVKAGVNVTVNDAASLAQLTSIDNANGTGTLTANSIEDTATLLAANAGGYIKSGVNVLVDGEASLTQLSTIDALNGGGTLAFNAIKDNAAALVTNAGNYVGNSVNVTVSDAATLAQLDTIQLKTSGTLTANQIHDSLSALSANVNNHVKLGVELTVTDAASIAALTLLDGTNGLASVTATTVSDDAAALVSNLGGYVKDAVNVVVAGAASVTQLANIDGKNGAASLTYGTVSDTAQNLLTDAQSTGTHYVVSGKNVEVNDAVSLATLAIIDQANGSGTLTATSVIDNAAHLLADTAYLSPSTAVTVDGAVNLADLKSIDDKSGVVTYNDIADNAASLLADPNGFVTGSVNVTVLDGTSVLNLATIFVKSTGAFHYSSIVDTAGNLVQESNSANGFVQGDIAITVTTSISLADLNKLDLAITGNLTYSSITDTAAHLAADTHSYINSDVAVNVDGAIALSDLVALAGKAGGVTYEEVSGEAADLAADASGNLGDGVFVTAGKAVEITGSATVLQLTAIKDAIGLGQLSYDTIEDTAAHLAADAATNTNAGTFTTGKAVIVTDAASIAQLAAISAVAVEIPTYTEIADTASNLTAPGSDTYVTGSVNVTVTSPVAIADLVAIDNLTTGKVTAIDLSDAAGNLVDVNGVASSYIGVGSNVAVTGAVTIAQLKAIDLANGDSGLLSYASITDTLEHLNAAGASAYITSGITVTVTDSTATVAQLAALDTASGGHLAYTGGIEDTASALSDDAALNSGVGKYTAGKVVTVSDAATLSQLAAVDNAAASLIYTKITDAAAGLAANAGDFVTDGKTVTVSDAATIQQLTTIDGLTDVALGYSKITDTAAHLFADSTYIKHGVIVALTDNGTVAAATLASIDGKTDVQVDASSVATVTGNFTDVKAVLSASTTLKLSGAESLSVTDSAADLVGQTLNANTSTHDVLNVGLASVTSNLSGLTGFEDIYLAGSNRSTNVITLGDGDGVSVHAQAASSVVLGSGHQSFFTSTGNDSVTVNAGSTFVFASTAAANGVDLIKNFSVGSNGSALDFSSFLGAFSTPGTEIVNDTSDFGGAAGVVTLLDGNSLGLASKNTIGVADFNSTFLSKVDGKEVVVTFDNTAHSANVYFVNSAGGGATNVVDSAADITLVGTVTYTGSISTAADLHLATSVLPV